jgi:hypothetical protein
MGEESIKDIDGKLGRKRDHSRRRLVDNTKMDL